MTRPRLWRRCGIELGDRGATLVEYSLVFALVAVVSVGAIQYIADEGEAEVENQAECIASRPPPPGCQIQSVTTSTTPNVAGTTFPPLPPPIPQVGVATWGLGIVQWTDPVAKVEWNVSTVVTAVGPPPTSEPLPGSLVLADAEFFGNDGATLGITPISCQTDAAGSCTLLSPNAGTGVARILIRLTDIQSEPDVTTFPAPRSGTRPS